MYHPGITHSLKIGNYFKMYLDYMSFTKKDQSTGFSFNQAPFHMENFQSLAQSKQQSEYIYMGSG